MGETNVLYEGDCLEVMKSIPDKSVDAIITDPPYGTTACKWDTCLDLPQMWKELNRIIKDNGAIVLFGGEPFASKLRMSNIENYKYDWYWKKNRFSNFLILKYQPGKVIENIIIFNKCNYYPIMRELSNISVKRNNRNRNTKYKAKSNYGGQYQNEIKTLNYKDRKMGYPLNVIEINTESSNQFVKKVFHPTQKPVALLEYLVKTYTLENELVLDFTAGSGTTGEACTNLKRNFILIEKEPEYCDLIENRLNIKRSQHVAI